MLYDYVERKRKENSGAQLHVTYLVAGNLIQNGHIVSVSFLKGVCELFVLVSSILFCNLWVKSWTCSLFPVTGTVCFCTCTKQGTISVPAYKWWGGKISWSWFGNTVLITHQGFSLINLNAVTRHLSILSLLLDSKDYKIVRRGPCEIS